MDRIRLGTHKLFDHHPGLCMELSQRDLQKGLRLDPKSLCKGRNARDRNLAFAGFHHRQHIRVGQARVPGDLFLGLVALLDGISQKCGSRGNGSGLGVGAPYTLEMAALSGEMDWSHKHLFDRMIAATAVKLACPLISKNPAFDQLAGSPDWVGRIWSEVPPDASSRNVGNP